MVEDSTCTSWTSSLAMTCREPNQSHGLTGIQTQMARTHPRLYIMKTARKLLDIAANSTDWWRDVNLTVVCILVELETMPSNDVAELSSIHNKQYRSKNGTLRYIILDKLRFRQLAFACNLLTPACNKWRYPAKNCVTKATSKIVKRFWSWRSM